MNREASNSFIRHMSWCFQVRPAVETVFENILLQLLLAKKIPSVRKFHLADGLNVDGVLESWGKIKPVSWKLGMNKLEMIGLKRT
ncbi:hypothetical protein YC2023_018838 [Brassica napus]